jgi:DNA polymerase
MFVGEAPGAEEDRIGEPFVGRAGKLLDRILEAAGLRREQVYITNAVLCRPPGNRTPTRRELRTCGVYLSAHVELIAPSIIVAMGSTAAQAFIGPEARITRLRGQWHEYRGIPLMPTFHPAALLRDPGKKRLVWADFKALRQRFDELRGQA